MPKARQTSVIGSPSRRRATKRRRSSMTEHSFQGIDTLRWSNPAKSVTHVSGTKRHLCLRTDNRLRNSRMKPKSRLAMSGSGVHAVRCTSFANMPWKNSARLATGAGSKYEPVTDLLGDGPLDVDSDRNGPAVLGRGADPLAVGILLERRDVCVAQMSQVLTGLVRREDVLDSGACGRCRVGRSLLRGFGGERGKGQAGGKHRGQRKCTGHLEAPDLCLGKCGGPAAQQVRQAPCGQMTSISAGK